MGIIGINEDVKMKGCGVSCRVWQNLDLGSVTTPIGYGHYIYSIAGPLRKQPQRSCSR